MSVQPILKSPPRAGRRSFQRLMRITLTLQSLTILVQAVTAGLLLASVPDGRAVHSMLAGAVLLCVLLNLGVAILAWRPGGGSPRLILKSIPMLLFTLVQMALGYARVRELHVPIGVLMFGASTMLLIQAWNGDRPARDGEAS
ncbi:hypothetical protein [Streptomyces sp. DH41]|uniref:hypothetical protein n=1 Tax=Streptomyces sp. DH41 TaxID=3040125 RepID=UPI0024422E64|nr:hypothetical protein [Streptomyces sp. DH41]MDG9726728.1 hypothetical protein [Streptomyces sp. DH41]